MEIMCTVITVPGVRIPFSPPKYRVPIGYSFLFYKREGDSKATVKKTCLRHVFRESADEPLALNTPHKTAQNFSRY